VTIEDVGNVEKGKGDESSMSRRGAGDGHEVGRAEIGSDV
jgi:hypothetical protein